MTKMRMPNAWQRTLMNQWTWLHSKEKIKGAIRTDFILSAEIVVISLGVMTASTLQTKALALSAIAILMTAGVYGLVALIVKLTTSV